MKRSAMQLMVLAAAISAAANVASAQSMTLKVPFSFSVRKIEMPAGNYRLSSTRTYTGQPVFNLMNTDTMRPIALMPTAPLSAGEKGYTDAKLVFRCSGAQCVLAQIWTGTHLGAFELPTPKSGADEKIRIEIRPTPAKTE